MEGVETWPPPYDLEAMAEWWQKAYPGAPPPDGLIPLARPLYPPDAAAQGKKPSPDGPDVEAIKRGISRGGRWPWQSFDRAFSNAFSHGKAGGNVGDSGVAGFQRQMLISDSGWWGEQSNGALQYALIPEGLANAGQHLLDDRARELLRQAVELFKDQPASQPLTRKAIPSPNYSSRGGATVRLIVLHTAEGARTIEELGNFFGSPSSQVSSHVGIDNKVGVIGEYVRREYKAWTAANANPVAVQAELCAFADWSASQWQQQPNMLENCARWIAEEARAFGLPLTKLTPSQAQGSGRGVCQHVDLGSWGGGHFDCGTEFPMSKVLEMAKGF